MEPRTPNAGSGVSFSSAPSFLCRLADLPKVSLNPAFDYSAELQKSLFGKRLLPQELSFSIESIHSHYANGYVSFEPGLRDADGRLICSRCGNSDRLGSFLCARCGRTCTYCRNCIMMGRVSTCTPLLTWSGPASMRSQLDNPLAWDGRLTPLQSHASEQISSSVGRLPEMLIWAVCGAGKTELLFEAVFRSLNRGLHVCLASPRTDVILELEPRFRKAFPFSEIIALYGGSSDNDKNGQLVLSTTHQLLRFHQTFDLVIIDEVDAFPFHHDASLQHAVAQAKQPDATVVYLTATPTNDLKKRFKSGELPGVRIPRRYHGHPLPVPVFVGCGHWKKQLQKGKLPATVIRWLETRGQRNIQAFLFVSEVEVMKRVAQCLVQRGISADGVHSEDPERRDKVQKFRDGALSVIVTTTILERGVTVAGAEVAVLGADEDVFTEQALVQIAGRVGRSSRSPGGEVVFFYEKKSREMVRARRHINGMNAEKGERL
ncbi:MAG TPA: DEAD/DEAH box helicase [Bacillales bacterium]|nr:DEAD/DEAH box helicase [Bacillales bacterium]